MMFQPQLRHPHRFRLARGPLVALTALTLGASALLWSPGSPVARAQETAGASADGRSYRLFYEKLGSDGDWLETDQYGYVFQPRTAVDDRNWRPYTDGYWAQTNAGWTWVSNEPFGWATYHYGRWANLVDVGWVWVPGSEWAPSYVSWRVSKDRKHVGWAPLPPEARLRKGAAIERWADTAYDIGPEAYVFIDTNRFGENSYRTHLLPAERNTTIITETENVTNVSYRTVENRSIIYGGGPDVAFIREGTGRPVREFQLETRAEPVTYFQGQDARGITSINGNRLIIATAAPDVITSSSLRVTQPATVRQHLNTITVDRGYRGVGDASVIDRVRATLRGQSPPPPPEIQREAHAAIQRNGAAVPPPAAAPGNAAAPRGAAMPPAPGASVNPSPAAAAATPAAGNAAPPPATPAARPSPAEAPHPGHTPPARREDAHPAATPVPEGHGAGTPKASSPASEKEAPPAAPAAAPKHRGEHAEKPPTPPAAAREEKPDAPASKRPASEPPAAAPEQPKVKPQRPPSEEPRARGEGAAPERHREPAANPAGENEKKPKAEAAPHESRRPEAPPAAAPRRAEPEARPTPGGGAAPAPAREGKREKPEPAGAPAGQGAAKPSPQP